MRILLLAILTLSLFACRSKQNKINADTVPAKDTAMNETELINHIKAAINPLYKDWVLFSNGTYIILPDSLKDDPERRSLEIMKEFGPVRIAGPAGDMSIAKLSNTEGWSVGGHYYGMYTYVHPDELIRAGIVDHDDINVGVYARTKRDKDSRELKLIYINNN